MNERFVKKLVLPSFVVVVLSTVFFNELQYVIDKIFFKEKHFLVIGILSAPGNFQQRLSIRKTWLQLLSDLSGSYYFIIGNEICEVPVLDRPDPYSCVSQPFILSQSQFSLESLFLFSFIIVIIKRIKLLQMSQLTQSFPQWKSPSTLQEKLLPFRIT